MPQRTRLSVNVSILVAVIGLFSGAIGAYVTASATSRGALRQTVLDLRKKAYADFLQGQTLLRAAHNQNEIDEANKVITDSKFNIFMVAPKAIICWMVKYWVTAKPQDFPPCKNPALERQNAAIYQTMRTEFFSSLNLRHAEIDPSLIIPYLSSCVLPDSKLDGNCR